MRVIVLRVLVYSCVRAACLIYRSMEHFEGKRETTVLLRSIAELHEGQDGLVNLGKLVECNNVRPPSVCCDACSRADGHRNWHVHNFWEIAQDVMPAAHALAGGIEYIYMCLSGVREFGGRDLWPSI